MKIASSAVNVQTSHVFSSASYISTQAVLSEARSEQPEPAEGSEDQLSLSDQAKQQAEQLKKRQQQLSEDLSAQSLSVASPRFKLPEDPMDLKLSILLRMIKMLTGKDFEAQPAKAKMPQEQGERPSGLRLGGVLASMGQSGRRTLAVEQTQVYHEYEATSYAAQGMVKTADGKTIAVDIELNMSREHTAYSKTSLQLSQNRSNVCDPLVINYGGTAASLTERKFSFDLNVDGQDDRISFAGPGSGFLALDKNGDGVINDGSELFGPQSGSGFADLRAYDRDGNDWIDENDAIYSQLSVWVKDEQGVDQLFSLKELDIGAIYLGEAETQFSVNDLDNNTHGLVRSTSFFLRDSGGAGTVQHIDLVT